MGQYYRIIFLSDIKYKKEIIRIWLSPWDYNNGSKIMEHSYIGNYLVNTVEELLSPSGMFYKSRIVWAGDYADTEKETGQNLYHMADENKQHLVEKKNTSPTNKYIINHTKKEYVDMNKIIDLTNSDELIIHPLPLLVSEGNGRGGGDYYGANEDMCGRWARDIISVENECPDDYTEIMPEFREQ